MAVNNIFNPISIFDYGVRLRNLTVDSCDAGLESIPLI